MNAPVAYGSTSCPPTKPNVPSSFILKSFDTLGNSIRCRIHTAVILTILDGHMRRLDNVDLLGTLLGIVSEGNVVEITDCFIAHNKVVEDGTFQLVKDHHESMYELKQKVNPKEQVVGWFFIGTKLTEVAYGFHSWFKSSPQVSRFVSHNPLTEPLILMVDPGIQAKRMQIKVYVQVPRLLTKDNLLQFQEIPSEVYSTDAEKSGLSLLLKARSTNPSHEPPMNREGLEQGLASLLDLIQQAENYVNSVLNRTINGNPEIGRALSKALSCEPVSQLEAFEQKCQTAVQDNLMVAYLATLARLQVAIAERLNTSLCL